MRRLLDDKSLADAGVEVDQVGTVDGYRLWSRTYDQPGNAAFDLDTPVVKDILDGLPVGVALDAACGTGRLVVHRRLAGDYLRAGLAAGFQLRRFEEPLPPAARYSGESPPAESPGPWDLWPWSLVALVPEAAKAAIADTPAMLICHFQLSA